MGWSGCGPIALLIENVLGFRCDGVRDRLVWHMHRADRHGIERLHFGDVTATVVYEPPVSGRPPRVTVHGDHSFELVIDRQGRSDTFTIGAGSREIELK